MSLSTSDFQQFLKSGESDLWSEEADDLLTILNWIGFEIQWDPVLLRSQPAMLTWAYWEHQLRWFEQFIEVLQDFRPNERLKAPIIYPPVPTEDMVRHLETYRRIKDARRLWNAFDAPAPLSPALTSKWRRTVEVLKFDGWRDFARLLKGLKWVMVSAGTFEHRFHTSRRQSSMCTITQTHPIQILASPIAEWVWDLMMSTSNPASVSNRPKVNVDWWSACLFCNRLSEVLGLEPAYEYRHYSWLDGLAREVPDSPHFAWSQSNGIRLPTQAEWLKLTRQHGGLTTTVPIQEWCWDTYDPHYWASQSVHHDPKGPRFFEDRKALVGQADGAQSKPIPFEDMKFQSDSIGFRIARAVD